MNLFFTFTSSGFRSLAGVTSQLEPGMTRLPVLPEIGKNASENTRYLALQNEHFTHTSEALG